VINFLKKVGDYFPYCLTIVNITDETNRPCVYANKMFQENTGYTASESIGRNLSYLQGELTSQDTIEFMRDSFNKKLACIQDIINYKKDGTPFLNRLLMLPINDQSTGDIFYLGIQNDITHEKGLEHNNKSLREVNNSEIRHMVNNPLAIILGHFELLFMKSNSPKQIDLAAKVLSETFNRINEYALNIETLSEFADFAPPRIMSSARSANDCSVSKPVP
jgi:PAS domain S-box-containing protein